MEYLGAAYAGFQSQPNKVTVQTTLETALSQVIGENIRIDGSGRTDAGAHACAQIIAFSTDSHMSEDTMRSAVNARLPFDIAVTRVSEVPSDYHPRFDAVSRTYRYLIWNRPVRSPFYQGRAAHVKKILDAERMNEALKLLCGRHDLGAFVPVRHQGSRERVIFSATCHREGDLVMMEIEATGFMRQMMRAIAGTAIRVGMDTLDLEGFARVLASTDRLQAGDTAPACGLYLVKVSYQRSDDCENAIQPSGASYATIPSPALFEEKS